MDDNFVNRKRKGNSCYRTKTAVYSLVRNRKRKEMVVTEKSSNLGVGINVKEPPFFQCG